MASRLVRSLFEELRSFDRLRVRGGTVMWSCDFVVGSDLHQLQL